MFDNEMAMVRIYGYTQGCEACDKLKDLLWRHNITFTFIPVGKKGSGCAHRKWVVAQGYDTVPQVWMDSTYIGNYGTIKNHLEPMEAEQYAESLLGWIPQTPPKLTEPVLRPAVKAMEEEEKSTRTLTETEKAQREEARKTLDNDGAAEACFINPLTGQKECS